MFPLPPRPEERWAGLRGAFGSVGESASIARTMIFLVRERRDLPFFFEAEILTPDVDALAGIVVPKMRKWASPGSSFEAELRIVDMLFASRYR